ncbi:hypothetical protein DPMN_075436 [Dreissena polymorpha]|uniref:Uncharacterized protein n=1 Tax=Dreissena polymorpha TaxID=45954 RepID=A0A9D3YKD0_DREPO|nr:hypothetical protein DPMN_075436 [Dreissena polymorpha]
MKRLQQRRHYAKRSRRRRSGPSHWSYPYGKGAISRCARITAPLAMSKDGTSTAEVRIRMTMATAAMARLNRLWTYSSSASPPSTSS